MTDYLEIGAVCKDNGYDCDTCKRRHECLFKPRARYIDPFDEQIARLSRLVCVSGLAICVALVIYGCSVAVRTRDRLEAANQAPLAETPVGIQ